MSDATRTSKFGPMNPLRSSRILLLTSTLLLSSCGTVGDAFGSLMVSDADEVKIGQQFDAQLRANHAEYPLYDLGSANHQKVKRYVDSVVQNILAQVPASERPAYYGNFQVTLIDAPVVNAFAVPGGFVYVYTGIIDSLRNEAEFAAVLGHEMTHVIHHHYRTLLAEQYGIQYVVNAVGGDSSALASIATNLLSLKLTRDHEADADRNGTILSAAAGYNPLGIADFFRRMPDAGWEVLSDHPSNQARVDSVTAQVRASADLARKAWSDYPANTVENAQNQFQSRFYAIRGILH